VQEIRTAMERLERYQAADAVQGWQRSLARKGSQIGYVYAGGETQRRDPGWRGEAAHPLGGVDGQTWQEPGDEPSSLNGSVSDPWDPARGAGPSEQDRPTEVKEVTQQLTEDGRYLLLAPVRAAGRDLGVMSFERRKPWSDEALHLVRAVMAQLDLALENARLLEDTRLRATQEAARGEIVARIRATTSTDAILRNAAEELGRALQVDRSRIQLVRSEGV